MLAINFVLSIIFSGSQGVIVGGTIAAILCVVTAALAVLLLSKLYIKRRQRKRINDIARYSDFI
jgi:uncharacterized protein (DUF2062 family)